MHRRNPLRRGSAIAFDVVVHGNKPCELFLHLREDLGVAPPSGKHLRRSVQRKVNPAVNEQHRAFGHVGGELFLGGFLLAHGGEGLVDGVLWLRPQEVVIPPLLIPSCQVCHLAEDAEVYLARIFQQVVLVLSADRQHLIGLAFDLVDDLPMLNATSPAERNALGNQHVIRGVPVDVAKVQLRDAEWKQVLATDVGEQLRGVQVASAAGNLHPVRLPRV
mmetsp:Transcript_68943/g.199998  ORF Transcript_68943/g.199998 Transcript_68943/m.199998 type:complete len:219 (-) Transcript_68943:652-1308(-)